MSTEAPGQLEPIEELCAYPRDLAETERALLPGEVTPKVGFAISGGGIRSATFALGLAQGLSDARLLRHVDVMSTVSGGGYFGAFYGHLLARPAAAQADSTPDSAEGSAAAAHPRAAADDVLRNRYSAAIRYLRANGRYLAPNGAGDLSAAAATVLRNWVSVLVVAGTVILAAFSVLALARYGLQAWIGTTLNALLGFPVWLSPAFVLALAAVPLFAVPPGWGYWLIEDGDGKQPVLDFFRRWTGLALAAAAVLVLWLTLPDVQGWPVRVHGVVFIAIVAVLAAIILTVVRFNLGRGTPHTARRHLSRGLARALVSILVLAVIGTLDTIGLLITHFATGYTGLGAGVAAISAWFSRPAVVWIADLLRERKIGKGLNTIAFVVVAAIILGFFGGIAAIPHLLARAYWELGDWAIVAAIAALTGLMLFIAWATSGLWYFLNRSSMHALYEARLRRAYLGASNPARTSEGDERPPVTEPHPGDGLKRAAYHPSKHGGPIHLINVTINETVDGRSQLQQRDRKGLGMAIGPAGVSVGVSHHARWSSVKAPTPVAADEASTAEWARRYRVFPTGKPIPSEDLEVGSWIAISGGAVSTGLGARTSPVFSILLGLFNVRLGYWWSSGVDVKARRNATERTMTQESLATLRGLLPMQMALFDEWFARFRGTSRIDWNLTDGGHFENLGGYELIRRELPLIIVSDAEEDASFTYDGLANLVRKARTDFGAEIEFLTDRDLGNLSREGFGDVTGAWGELPRSIGTLEQLRRGRRTTDQARDPETRADRIVVEHRDEALSFCHGAIARITYASGKYGYLLYVKPSLDGDEPADVREYHQDHPGFPHESTGDQFFDESQWESYRRLGEHIAQELFGGGSALAEQVRRAANDLRTTHSIR